jgi:solute:Na+ symporter, SSS family
MEAVAQLFPLLPLAVFGPIDWGILVGYFALMIYMGVVASRKDQDAGEYFLAHRSMPTWAVAISIVATSLSAATFVGVPDLAYKGNLTYLTLYLGALVSVVVVSIVFIPKLYSAGTVTIYGYLGQRWGEGAMIAVSAMFLVGRMLASGARLFIAAIPLCLLMFAKQGDIGYEPTRQQLVIAICLIGLIGTFYTSFGGIRTIIWIDVIQFLIVLGAAAVSVYMLLRNIGLPAHELYRVLAAPHSGPEGHSKLFLVDTSRDPNRPYTIWAALLGYTFLTTAAFGVDQDLAQRFLVAKSITRGAMSLIWSQLISIGVVLVFMTIGLLLYIFYQRPDIMGENTPASPPGTQATYAWFLLNQMPTVMSGIAIAGFFAIAQGSMDSAINALASSAVADVYYPLRRKMGIAEDASRDTVMPKLAVAAMGALMTALGIVCIFLYDKSNRTLIDFALGVLSFAFTGMLGVFLTALLTRRGNTASVIAALIVGVISVALMQPPVLAAWSNFFFHHPLKLASTWWTPIGTIVSFLVCVSGSPSAADFPPPLVLRGRTGEGFVGTVNDE